ncbi:MAG: uracil phosphoribosyltransferase [Muribaculaceae bacterium]|nr:uracil phosphoribosyltransferase [Muribaculaceae bacterium]
MEIINLDKTPSLLSRFTRELRDVTIQGDSLRFRKNLERIGEVMAYEISKKMDFHDEEVVTPLARASVKEISDRVVIATILRAGLPFHHGFLNYFDRADNAFVSAYRSYREKGDKFEVLVEYLASPDIEGKTLIIVDPMLATGSSMELGYRALLRNGNPAKIHVAAVIASQAAVEYVAKVFPQDKTTIWCATIDPEINSHSYIVPGLGDAGDLSYGVKL